MLDQETIETVNKEDNLDQSMLETLTSELKHGKLKISSAAVERSRMLDNHKTKMDNKEDLHLLDSKKLNQLKPHLILQAWSLREEALESANSKDKREKQEEMTIDIDS